MRVSGDTFAHPRVGRCAPGNNAALKPATRPEALVERNDGNTPPFCGKVVAYNPASLASTADNELYLAVAQVRFQANLDEGLPRLEAAIAKYSPPQGEFYFRLGEAYRDAGKIDKAIAAYRQAYSHTPDWRFLYALGTALSAFGQLDQSEEAMNRARSLPRARWSCCTRFPASTPGRVNPRQH